MTTPTPDGICERLDAATPSQIERANAAVQMNLNDDGSPKFDSAQGYACALTAIIASDDLIQQQQATIERLSAALVEGIRELAACVGHSCTCDECNRLRAVCERLRAALGKDASDVRSPGSSEWE